MGRSKGRKNIKRTIEEKEQIVSEYINENLGLRPMAKKYQTSHHVTQG